MPKERRMEEMIMPVIDSKRRGFRPTRCRKMLVSRWLDPKAVQRLLASTKNIGGKVITAFNTAIPIPISPAWSGTIGFKMVVE